MCWTRPRSNLNMWYGLSHSHKPYYKTHFHIQTSETYSNNTTTHTHWTHLLMLAGYSATRNKQVKNKQTPIWSPQHGTAFYTLWCVTFRFNNKKTVIICNTDAAVISPTQYTQGILNPSIEYLILNGKEFILSGNVCLWTDTFSKWQFS